MPFPWELLRVNERFIIGARGSHVVRDVPASGGTRRRRPIHNVVHMSLGTDSALRFDEERRTLLDTLPANIPIEFLIDPSPRHLKAVMDVFRPHIVIVSGHGHYDDLQGEHYLATEQGHLRTARLVALCASYGCQLLVLSTCESARLGGPVMSAEISQKVPNGSAIGRDGSITQRGRHGLRHWPEELRQRMRGERNTFSFHDCDGGVGRMIRATARAYCSQTSCGAS
jgi:hypothetical protein